MHEMLDETREREIDHHTGNFLSNSSWQVSYLSFTPPANQQMQEAGPGRVQSQARVR